MTDDSDFTRIVRERMERTGENYTTARAALRPDATPTQHKGTRSHDTDTAERHQELPLDSAPSTGSSGVTVEEVWTWMAAGLTP